RPDRVAISPSLLANGANRSPRNPSATYSRPPVALLACQAQPTACAKSLRPGRRTTEPPSRNLKPSSDGPAAPWPRSTPDRLTANVWLSRLCTNLRTTSEHLFPHLMERCARKRKNPNEISTEKSQWWAREERHKPISSMACVSNSCKRPL